MRLLVGCCAFGACCAFKHYPNESNIKNENIEINIEGTVIKVELKTPLNVIQKPRLENASKDPKVQNQNVLSIEETIDLNSEENSSALNQKPLIVKKQHICEICKKHFATRSLFKSHMKTVHDEVKDHKCDMCDKTFGKNSELRIHVQGVHNLMKQHVCVTCNKKFGLKSVLKKHIK